MKILLFILFTSISYLNFAQTWSGEANGHRYKLEKSSSGVYILTAKFDNGQVVKSKLTRTGTTSNEYKGSPSWRSCSREERCREIIIGGGGRAWDDCVLRWYDTPFCIMGLCSELDLIHSDGFDTGMITFRRD